MMRAVLLAVAVAACGGSSPGDAHVGAQTVADAPANGCTASARIDVCVQDPYGSETCTNACTASEYGLSCTNAEPEASLRCTIVPVPTPAGVSLYCCPS